MLNLKLLGYVCCGSKFGFYTLVVFGSVFKRKRSWRSEERCAAFLFGTVSGVAVHALDCKKELDVYATFKNVTKNPMGGTSSRGRQRFLHHWRLQCGAGFPMYR